MTAARTRAVAEERYRADGASLRRRRPPGKDWDSCRLRSSPGAARSGMAGGHSRQFGASTAFTRAASRLSTTATWRQRRVRLNRGDPVLPVSKQNLEIVYDNATREQALSFARSLLLRQLTFVQPGELQFCFFDPVGLGQSAADLLDLAEYDAGLIGGKVWSSAGDLAARLADQASHVELVIQKYLRATYATIDEFNGAAGEIAEPYRQLAFFDFPTSFSEEAAARLKSILQNGPRCGVYTVLLTNRSVTPAYGVDLSQLSGDVRRISFGANFAEQHEGYSLQMRRRPETDWRRPAGGQGSSTWSGAGLRAAPKLPLPSRRSSGCSPPSPGRGIRTELSAAAAATVTGDESTWWRDNSIRGLFAPLGQKGARDAAILSFDSATMPGLCWSAARVRASRRCCTRSSAASPRSTDPTSWSCT